MADASTSRQWQVFLVLGLIACVASFYFLVGGGTFAAVSSLVAISITLLNAFLSPATAKEGENWFVGAMKRTLVVGSYAKVVCVLLWIAAFINVAMLAGAAYEKKFRVDIEGLVIDKFLGTPLEKALVTLKLTDGTTLSSDAPAGRFKFTAVDRRKVAKGQADLEAVCESVHGKVSVDLLKGSVKDARIILSVSLPPIKRTFFVLKGHAIDILVRDKKLPTELETKLGGNIFLVDTPPFRELRALTDRFSERMEGSEFMELSTDVNFKDLDAQANQREAALKKIEKEQLKRLTRGRVLAPAAGENGGHGTYMEFDAAKLPQTFFANAPWSIGASDLDEVVMKRGRAKSRNSTRLEIPLEKVDLKMLATRADFDVLRRAKFRDSPEIRFIEYASRNGIPSDFLYVSAGWDACGQAPVVSLDVPNLQLRVVVLENITDKPVELGNFHFRLIAPGASEALVRRAQDNARLFAGRDSKSEAWYSPHLIRPGEKVAVPLELILNFGENVDRSPTGPDETDGQTEGLRRSHKYAERLRVDKDLQTIALVYKKDDLNARQTALVTMPKQKFIDGLERESVHVGKTEFVFGPSIALDAIDVNGAQYAIEPFNPAYVAYFSGSGMGSCPFVYCHGNSDRHWVRQGTILKGHKSKALAGIGELTVHGFDGTLRITEEEAEISYIDELFVRARSPTGESVTLRPADERLAHKDGHDVVLNKGESIDVKFAIPNGVLTDQVRISASGYFESTSPTAER